MIWSAVSIFFVDIVDVDIGAAFARRMANRSTSRAPEVRQSMPGVDVQNVRRFILFYQLDTMILINFQGCASCAC